MNLPTIFLLLMVGVVGLSFQVSADAPKPTPSPPNPSPAPTVNPKPTLAPTTAIPTSTPKPGPTESYNYMFDFFSRGFDARTQNFYGAIMDNSTWKNKLYDYSHTNHETWKDPESNIIYKVPDLIKFVSNHESFSIIPKVFDNFTNLEYLLTPNASAVQTPGNFRNQTKQTTLMSVLAAETIYTKSRVLIGRMYNNKLYPDPTFNKRLMDLAKLPFATNQAAYESFFNDYGTHSIQEIEFGGILRIKCEINATYYHTTLNRNATSVYKGILEYLASFMSNSKINLTDFVNHTVFTPYYVGGDVKKAKDFKSWINTINSNRVPVKITLEPIYKYIDEILEKKIEHIKFAWETMMIKYEMEQGRDIHWDFNTSPNKFGRDHQNFPKNMAEYFEEYLTQMKEGYPWRNATYVGGCYPRLRMNVNYFAGLRDNIKVR